MSLPGSGLGPRVTVGIAFLESLPAMYAAEVLLLSVQSKERGEMLYEERLEAAERRRLEGNALFKNGQCRDALGKYAAAGTALCIAPAVVLSKYILCHMTLTIAT